MNNSISDNNNGMKINLAGYRIYFYPKMNYEKSVSKNPYIYNLEQSLLKNHTLVNNNNNYIGVLDFFKYLFIADLFLFNWIEDLPFKRYGKFQVAFFILFLIIAKLLKRKILWVLHNKYSHDKNRNVWTNFMFNMMMKYSNFILTHSKGGLDFVKEHYPKNLNKVSYIIHPVQHFLSFGPNKTKQYDFLIWGTIFPYKGVVPFLKFINESKNIPLYKILIIGQCIDKNYKSQIKEYLSEHIIYDDTFYDMEEIKDFANRSKFILFTHKPISVLSSGSLMDSIRLGTPIIGPDHGAFKDLSNYSFIKTYSGFEEIISISNNAYNGTQNFMEIEDFCNNNSWNLFADKLDIELKRVFKCNDLSPQTL